MQYLHLHFPLFFYHLPYHDYCFIPSPLSFFIIVLPLFSYLTMWAILIVIFHHYFTSTAIIAVACNIDMFKIPFFLIISDDCLQIWRWPCCLNSCNCNCMTSSPPFFTSALSLCCFICHHAPPLFTISMIILPLPLPLP